MESGTEVESTKGLLEVSGSEDCLSPKLKVLLGASEVVVGPPNTVLPNPNAGLVVAKDPPDIDGEVAPPNFNEEVGVALSNIDEVVVAPPNIDEVVMLAPPNIDEVVVFALPNTGEVVVLAPPNIKDVVVTAPPNIEVVVLVPPNIGDAVVVMPPDTDLPGLNTDGVAPALPPNTEAADFGMLPNTEPVVVVLPPNTDSDEVPKLGGPV